MIAKPTDCLQLSSTPCFDESASPGKCRVDLWSSTLKDAGWLQKLGCLDIVATVFRTLAAAAYSSEVNLVKFYVHTIKTQPDITITQKVKMEVHM